MFRAILPELGNVNSIHRATIDGTGNTLMITRMRVNTSTDTMLRFTVTYDSVEEWDTTTGTPGTTELDFKGAMTHEFGQPGAGGGSPIGIKAGQETSVRGPLVVTRCALPCRQVTPGSAALSLTMDTRSIVSIDVLIEGCPGAVELRERPT